MDTSSNPLFNCCYHYIIGYKKYNMFYTSLEYHIIFIQVSESILRSYCHVSTFVTHGIHVMSRNFTVSIYISYNYYYTFTVTN